MPVTPSVGLPTRSFRRLAVRRTVRPMAIVIVGAGLAGGTAATELREHGYDGRVVLIGAEEHPPYERPPLSKGYLLGNDPLDVAFVHPREWYADHDVELRLGVRATAVDLSARVVRTTAGDESFDGLLLATGAEPRRLALAEESGVPTAYLRTIEDSDRLKAAFGAGRRIVIVGAGWIGLEAAAAARAAGSDVTVFETAELPLLRVLGPTVAGMFAGLHREHGVDLRLGTSVTTTDLAAADLVVAGVGVSPRVELAKEAGLAVEDGVLVDARLRTSSPSVFAVGDIANHDHPVLGRRIRVEHWDTALNQAKVAARNLAGGDELYEAMPYFFTDQYDLGMEYVGHGGADDEVVVHGDLEGRVFRAFWLREGRVVAAMHANDWDATDDLRAAVASGELPAG
ncbi:MAG: ferredoxin reductase [Ornithinibacter sp.]|jgi:3-phenylpropionate/trans-cinnamate dioxygenase ferredoxin reductase subunit|nr:ferredoxin reductase [Ornithinibacter sp.]